MKNKINKLLFEKPYIIVIFSVLYPFILAKSIAFCDWTDWNPGKYLLSEPIVKEAPENVNGDSIQYPTIIETIAGSLISKPNEDERWSKSEQIFLPDKVAGSLAIQYPIIVENIAGSLVSPAVDSENNDNYKGSESDTSDTSASESDSNNGSDAISLIHLFEGYKSHLAGYKIRDEIIQRSMDFMRTQFPPEYLANASDVNQFQINMIKALAEIPTTTPVEVKLVDLFRISISTYNAGVEYHIADNDLSLKKIFISHMNNPS